MIFTKTITLDIINSGDVCREIITLGEFVQVKRPMLSIFSALESIQEEIKEKQKITYLLLQKSIIENLFGLTSEEISISLEAYGGSLDDYIDAASPIRITDEKEMALFEIDVLINEFFPYLLPGKLTIASEGNPFQKGFIKRLNGYTPSEKYSEAMSYFNSYEISPDLLSDMIYTIYGQEIQPVALRTDRTFILALKSIRYSQLSDDIRYICFKDKTINTSRSDAYKGQKMETHYYSFEKEKKLISRCYYSSNGIFPLIWAELKYAIENDIFVSKCYCGKHFIQNKKNNQKYCSNKCRDKHRKDEEMLNPNRDEINRLKVRKSRLKKKLIECRDKREMEKLQNMIDDLQKEIDAFKKY